MGTEAWAAGLSTDQLAELLQLARRADERLETVERDLRASEELRMRQERWKWPARLLGVVIGFLASIVTNQIASATWATEVYRQGETAVIGVIAAANDTRAVWLPWVAGLLGLVFLVVFVVAIVANFRRPHRHTKVAYRASVDFDDGQLVEAGFAGASRKPATPGTAPPGVKYARRAQGRFERELQEILGGKTG